jgi:predicted NBD/HSP70 family sugar kinase
MNDIRKKLLEIKRDERLCHIYREIQNNGPLSKSQIGLSLPISKPTRYSLINSLLNDGVIKEIENGNTRSQKGSKVDIVEDLYFSLGIDIHLRGIDFMIMDLKHQIIDYREVSNNIDEQKNVCLDDKDTVLDRMIKGTNKILSDNAIPKEHIISVGISDFGIIDSNEGISVFTPHIPGWKDVPLKSILNRLLPVPIYINRDANLMAIAEVAHLEEKDFDDILLVAVRRGVGLGIFIDGKLYEGHSGGAGEWSHTTVDPNGKQCTCGKKGCIDTILGYQALMSIGNDILKGGKKTVLREMMKQNGELSPELLFKSYETDDKTTNKYMNTYIDRLGKQMANLLYIFDPYMFILSGQLSNTGVHFMKKLDQCIKAYLPGHMKHKVQLKRGSLGLKAASWGAAYMSQENFFS